VNYFVTAPWHNTRKRGTSNSDSGQLEARGWPLILIQIVATPIMARLQLMAARLILSWNQFFDRQNRGRHKMRNYRNSKKNPQKFPKIYQSKRPSRNVDGFLTKADYNEHTGWMSAVCVPRLRRNASKTNSLRATGDGLSNNKIPCGHGVHTCTVHVNL
jgi:hypothetical protein